LKWLKKTKPEEGLKYYEDYQESGLMEASQAFSAPSSPNIAADRWFSRHVFDINFISSLKSWVIRQPSGDFLTIIYRFLKRILRK
jgi:hypothetical protein